MTARARAHIFHNAVRGTANASSSSEEDMSRASKGDGKVIVIMCETAEQKPADTPKNGMTHASSDFRQYLPRNLCFGWTCHLSNFNLQISAEIYSCDFPRPAIRKGGA